MNKAAILAELARAGSHLLGRSPEATAATEGAVRGAVGHLEAGAKKLLNTPIPGTPELLPGKVTGPLRKGVDFAIENPETILGTATPIPGGGMLAHAGKKALERGLNSIAPAATPKLAARYKLEGDALIEVGPDGKSLGKCPANKDYNKKAFAVSQYSGALNPVIHSGASVLPPAKMPQLTAAIQKNAFASSAYDAGPAPTWSHDHAAPSGASYLAPFKAPRLSAAVQKTAELAVFLQKIAETNIGQWWEQVGGPHLAKGGSHAEFKKMMEKEGLSEGVQKKFMDIAKEKYPKGYGAPASVPSGAPVYQQPALGKIEKAINIAGGLGALAIGAHLVLSPKKEEADTPYASWKGRVGAHLATTAPLAYGAQEVARMFGAKPSTRALFALGGAAVGGGAAEMALHKLEAESAGKGRRAATTAGGQRRIAREAETTAAGHGRNVLGPLLLSVAAYPILSGLRYGSRGQTGNTGTELGVAALSALGIGMLEKHKAMKAYEAMKARRDEPKRKTAAGAPTRGGFMMASDMPGYQPPRLDQAVQKFSGFDTDPYTSIFKGAKPKPMPKKEKDGDALPEGMALQPWDNFKRVNINAKHAYAMPTEKLASFVEGLLKEAIPGLTPQSRLEQSTSIGAPMAKPPAAPGPSIADQAKPKGPGFGTGIAGAMKGGIGGTSVGGIGRMTSPPQV